ncbi:hypothetical protein LCGC14_1751550, partial [marine sediment metagenome]
MDAEVPAKNVATEITNAIKKWSASKGKSGIKETRRGLSGEYGNMPYAIKRQSQ